MDLRRNKVTSKPITQPTLACFSSKGVKENRFNSLEVKDIKHQLSQKLRSLSYLFHSNQQR